MKAKKPYWSLEKVKALAASGKLILSKTKAQKSFADPATAMAAAKATIGDLTERQFAETLKQVDTCDVYGVRINGSGWYLKVTIDELLVVVSLHPLAGPLKTNSGVLHPGPLPNEGR
jgi:hypothetical protein